MLSFKIKSKIYIFLMALQTMAAASCQSDSISGKSTTINEQPQKSTVQNQTIEPCCQSNIPYRFAVSVL